MNIVKVLLFDEITGEEDLIIIDTDEIKTGFYTLLLQEVANDDSLPF